MANYITTDHDLIKIIQAAEESDLAIIADFITDRNNGRISLDTTIRTQIDTFKRCATLKNNSDLLIKEVQEFGGNSIVNFFRGSGVVYREILDDVADHMKVKIEKTDSAEQIELKILLAVAVKGMEQMKPEEQKSFFSKLTGGKIVGFGPGAIAALQASILAGGFSSYILATTVANAVATTLIGRGLALGVNAAFMRGLAGIAGPIGWAITAIWTAFDLASPAYRVTVPCVVQIAYMRQKAKVTEFPSCSQCGSAMTPDQKFCAECGAKSGV
ncbi:MAG TPA: ubiquinol-cytochrome C chaperone family protein [Zoogloea sp.]|uniref:ubiquinol-cytochrome C chaperone family protein n=1 Tax=Zoogloea sp. TaxID=49181 RepID=UPI002C9DC4FE|nr:ubiquinol-cytochrome C chaperone family protein [Zoogloea sp.]HMV18699.1 ubiquinol-cytochrome C chaperone family protein [Rhodocyclaceae bacterium]HNB66029.1 ubiquinol-cytochrome C chaperone family protein [Rhodocyclaceae bacterium]HNI49095.1 ubiquinol-cytochrome C chaperone family protein [Zoogloea sp.]